MNFCECLWNVRGCELFALSNSDQRFRCRSGISPYALPQFEIQFAGRTTDLNRFHVGGELSFSVALQMCWIDLTYNVVRVCVCMCVCVYRCVWRVNKTMVILYICIVLRFCSVISHIMEEFRYKSRLHFYCSDFTGSNERVCKKEYVFFPFVFELFLQSIWLGVGSQILRLKKMCISIYEYIQQLLHFVNR